MSAIGLVKLITKFIPKDVTFFAFATCMVIS